MSKKNRSSRTSSRTKAQLLKKQARRMQRKRGFQMETLEERVVLATSPFLQAIAVDDGSLLSNIENTAPREMTLRFDEDQIISSQESSLAGITLVQGGPDRQLDTADDIIVTPGFVGIGGKPNEVVLRFAENLPDSMYRLTIRGTGATPLRNVDGDVFDADPDVGGVQDFSRDFRLDLGAQVLSVIPQPTFRNPDGSVGQALDQIVVHFNNDPLDPTSAENPNFYQLRFTGHTDEFNASFDTVSDLDDVVHFPESVDYDAATRRAVLTFSDHLHELDNDLPGIDRVDGTGTYRLQIGVTEAVPLKNAPDVVVPLSDPGDHFFTAEDLGEVFARGIEVTARIDPRVAPIDYPGAIDEPGHRDIPEEVHLGGPFDIYPGATTIFYNFRDVYGQDPDGNDLHNLITENQKELTRQILEIYSVEAGVQFVESDDLGFTVVTGDLRALAPGVPTGPGGVLGIATVGAFVDGMAIMDAAEDWTDEFAAQDGSQFSWFETAMHEIGHILGIGHSYDLAPPTVMGGDFSQAVSRVEPIYPGDHDITHVQHLHRPESNDVDLYKFEVSSPGVTTIETSAERLANASLLDTQLVVWRETGLGRERIAHNDNYFSNDSHLELSLEPGIYYVGVSSTGNGEYNPLLPNSGEGGTSEGPYQLRIQHRPELSPAQQMQDAIESLHPSPLFTPTVSQALDGDADGTPGGAHNFWFRVATPEDTLLVDKAGGGEYTQIDAAMSDATAGTIVRVVGNGGSDGTLSTLADNQPYLIGRNVFGGVLEDGTRIDVKRGVTLMVDEGAILKFRNSAIVAGSTSPGVDRSGSAVQILGTPENQVHLGSFQDDTLGGDSDGLGTAPRSGDWGGVLFSGITDKNVGRFHYEDHSIFLNSVNHARFSHAGGTVSIDSVNQVVAPIEMRDIRATALFNHVSLSADAAIAASPDTFLETNFHAPRYQATPFTSDYTRIGPDIYGNLLDDNSVNGLIIRTAVPSSGEPRALTVSGRWDDTDIPHVVTDNLVIQGLSGNAFLDPNNVLTPPQDGVLIARPDARLRVDPGIVVKLDGSMIEVGLGAQLIAEGSDSMEVTFTSLNDDRFGGSGTFDTTSDGIATRPSPGDWGGIYLGFLADGSIDRSLITFGGGQVPLEGTFTAFNAIEVHHAQLRLTNSTLEQNAGGTGGQGQATRDGRTANESAAIFIRDAQPIIVNNVIQNNQAVDTEPAASAISIDVNSLNWHRIVDWGRATGPAEYVGNDIDNQGPLFRGNRLGGNDANGLEVRGAALTTESVWDDTDIVHLVFEEIAAPNFHTFSGLRLESSATQSLVVKLLGPDAGLTAAGRTLDIDDRIGGTVQIVGHPNFPVVLTSALDNTVGAGLTPTGEPQLVVFEDRTFFSPTPGDWRSVRVLPYSNDRNVATVVEFEATDIDFGNPDNPRDNGFTENAQFLGTLAPNEKAGDDNLRLGFDVHGTLASIDDEDVYSFTATGGTEVWIDLDQTTNSLDSVVELITADGFVLASSESSHFESEPFIHSDPGRPAINANGLSKSGYYTDDAFTINARDPGMRVVLPESGVSTYHIRVRSTGLGPGGYEMQVRLREVDEVAGSTVTFADIRYATNGVELFGAPGHSPLLGESAEADNTANDDFANAQLIGNVLDSDRAALAVAGNLSTRDDVDWYQFQVGYPGIQGGGSNQDADSDLYSGITFDIDYADGASRPNTSIAVYNDRGDLVAYGNTSNISDDLNAPSQGADVSDLTRGSLGTNDAMIGPISLVTGIYHVAVFSDAQIPQEMELQYLEVDRDAFGRIVNADQVHRFGPNDATVTIAKDRGDGAGPLLLDPVLLTLNEARIFVSTDQQMGTTGLHTVNPFNGAVEYNLNVFGQEVSDIALREDDRLFSLTIGLNDEDSGNLVEVNPATGELLESEGDDEIATNMLNEEGDDVEEANVGVHFYGMTFGPWNDGTRQFDDFWAVGELGDPSISGPAYAENILYLLNRDTFTADDPADPNRETYPDDFEGGTSFTDIVERGEIQASGRVTGLAFVGTTLYAVSDRGDLVRINDPYAAAIPLGGGIQTTTVANLGASFAGLAAGPVTLSEGMFEDALFAIDDAGTIYAFDTMGNPLPVFEGDATSIDTGLAGANGIQFANYEENLWHPLDPGVESTRFGDPGHGVVTPVTEITEGGTRGGPDELDNKEAPGDASFYFGSSQTQPGRRTEVSDYTYNFTGGARGSLRSEPFDLTNYDSNDEPFVYFNYVLDTQGQNGSGGEAMRDSFRVYLEDEDGTFHLLATNNSTRNTTSSEYTFDPTQNSAGYGRVQELFDHTDVNHVRDPDDPDFYRPTAWRQARVPLREFAGQTGLRLRFDFSTSGGMNDARLPADNHGKYASDFGDFDTGLFNNVHEGAYIDDVIIGFAERGELVTGEHRHGDAFTPPVPTFAENRAIRPNQILTGGYQLEIRRSLEYSAQGVIDTNDRLAQGFTILAGAAADLPEGSSFTLSNGLESFTFEFIEGGRASTIPGAIPVGYQPGAGQPAVSLALVNAINDANDALGTGITAGFVRGVTNYIDLHGDFVLMEDRGALANVMAFDDVGDRNRVRDQGQIIISSNTIRDSEEFGVRAEAAPRDGSDGNNPHPGSTIGFVEANDEQLAPGATIVNNVIARSGAGGILVAGDIATGAPPSTPFARVINNTVVGAVDGSTNGIGIEVRDNASPTLLNNILDSLDTAISVDATSSSTVVGGSLYRNSPNIPVLGDFATVMSTDEPLFVDALNDNFYPAVQSPAIDSGVASLDDRTSLVRVREPLGIAPSPVTAPLRDGAGQLRIDDPDVDNNTGQGSGVFIDRGALERSDFLGPNATLIGPRDNDAAGVDLDRNANDVTIIEDEDNPLFQFIVQLTDAGGSDPTLGGFGVDDASVLTSSIVLTRDDQELDEGIDYSLEYDSTNNQIRLLPASGIWTAATYRIELLEPIRDLFGNPLLPNRTDGSTTFNIVLSTATFDFGDAPAPYPTTLSQDGARHSIQDDFFLGAAVDSESDAAVEDTNDDGVAFNGDIVPGSSATATVTASKGGRLDAWIDFNGDGDWDDAGEQVATSLIVSAGANQVTYPVPLDAVPGDVYSRFRLSANGGLTPFGLAGGGEVEDYPVTIETPGIDFGDAPAPYPTLLSDDGARHDIQPGFFLGAGVDGESDGQPSSGADLDADDGVTFTSSLAIARTATLDVVSSGDGVVDAWIDFNADGDWDDAGEQILTGVAVSTGTNALTIDVDANATAGMTFARFRLSSTGGLSPTGAASDGEVEDYLISIDETPLDYGDAPDPFYPTLLANDGARHAIIDGVHLGSSNDSEADGQPTPTADGDGGSDDGVSIGVLAIGQAASVNVTASTDGFLDAWIDFNADGDWLDAGEQIFVSTALSTGSNSLSVAVPDGAFEGSTYARFRFSTAGGLGVTGKADDGEVEDYLVDVVTGSGWHNFVLPADVNNDGSVAPLDALLVINELNLREFSDPNTGELPSPTPPPFVDVNNDGFASPLDAILVINQLNAAAPQAALSSSAGSASLASDSGQAASRELAFADLGGEAGRNSRSTPSRDFRDVHDAVFGEFE